MNDPHQFFLLKQGCDDLIPWKNPDCGSKQNVYKMVKKRKWTEEDAEKEKREEEGLDDSSGKGIHAPKIHTDTSTIAKRLKKILPLEEEPTLKEIEKDEKDKPKESIMQMIQEQIEQENEHRIYNPFSKKLHYYGYPGFY